MRIVGKLDLSIYRCVASDISNDEVIITEERIRHIEERHPGDYEEIAPFLQAAVVAPDYILENAGNTGIILKLIEQDGTRLQIVLRLHTAADEKGFKNSILSAWKISESCWNNYVRNKRILYKRE